MPDLLEQIRTTQRARRSDAEARYRQAVREAAEGKELDPEDVLELLEEIGVEAEQFAKDTAVVVHRRELRAQVATIPELKSAVADLERVWKLASDDFVAVRKAYQERAFQWHHRQKELNNRIREAEAAVEKLREGCPDESLKRRAEHLAGALDSAAKDLSREKGLLANHRAALGGLEHKAISAREGLYAEDIASMKVRIETASRKIAEIEARIVELQAAELANSEAMRNA